MSAGDSKPWLGFIVKQKPGKTNLYLSEVAPGGPAEQAGLQNDDELLKLNGVRTYSMDAFRAAFDSHAVPGRLIRIDVLRDQGDGNVLHGEVQLLVGQKEATTAPALPQFQKVAELEAILTNPTRLREVAQSITATVDGGVCGLVTRQEFIIMMRRWLDPMLPQFTSEHFYIRAFDEVDKQKGGVLTEQDLVSAVGAVFDLIVQHYYAEAPEPPAAPVLDSPAVRYNTSELTTASYDQSGLLVSGGPKRYVSGGLVVQHGPYVFPATTIRHPTHYYVEDAAAAERAQEIVTRVKVFEYLPSLGEAPPDESSFVAVPAYGHRVCARCMQGTPEMDLDLLYPLCPTCRELDPNLDFFADKKLDRVLTFRLCDRCQCKKPRETDFSTSEWVCNDCRIREAGGVPTTQGGRTSTSATRLTSPTTAAPSTTYSRRESLTRVRQELDSVEFPTPARAAPKPWIGFAVKKEIGKQAVTVHDVAEGGPADQAGLQDRDVLTSFSGVRVSDMNTFHNAFARHAIVGATIPLEILRGKQRLTVDLKVGEKAGRAAPRPAFTPLSGTDVNNCLADGALLQEVARAAFDSTDSDASGLISRKEFVSAVRGWFAPELISGVTDNQIKKIHLECDVDGSGFLVRSEFGVVFNKLLRLIQSGGAPNGVASGPTEDLSSAPKAWVGFVVKKVPSKAAILVHQVEPGGPAEAAALKEGDVLNYFAGSRPYTVAAFRKAVTKLVPGSNVDVEFTRDGSIKKRTATLTVGSRRKRTFPNAPALATGADLINVSGNPADLKTIASVIFAECDRECTGIITKSEFVEGVRSWLPGVANAAIMEADLQGMFDNIDADKSGYVTESAFVPAVQALLSLLVSKVGSAWEAPAAGPKLSPTLGLGVSMTGRGSASQAIVVDDIQINGPAKKAGLAVGDVITGWKGEPLADLSQFVAKVKGSKVGETIELQIRRGTEDMVCTVIVEGKPARV